MEASESKSVNFDYISYGVNSLRLGDLYIVKKEVTMATDLVGWFLINGLLSITKLSQTFIILKEFVWLKIKVKRKPEMLSDITSIEVAIQLSCLYGCLRA